VSSNGKSPNGRVVTIEDASANGHGPVPPAVDGSPNGASANGHGVAPTPTRRFSRLARQAIGTAVVGYGYWGPNLVRNVAECPELSLEVMCDCDPVQIRPFAQRHPGTRATTSYEEILADDAVDAVLIATPPRSHYELARRALQAGKHVLVEKPMATTPADAQDLADLAEAEGLVLMPGHTFIYSPPVNTVYELIRGNVVGDIHFVTSSRMNLGKYQRDGVVCDLAPHDLSILLYWLGEPVIEVAASGHTAFEQGVPETAFLTLNFASGTTANVQISWLAPRKVRQMVVVGSKRMVQYDDTASDEAVRVYDRGMEVRPPANFGEHQLVCRTGDVVIPRIDPAEPLSLELADFAAAIKTGVEPRSNVALGMHIVEVLEAANRSLLERGAPIEVSPRTKLML
jgi:predicted dehydrogenase